MHLEYVGHKPVIGHTGVDFSIGKEDKYVYIEPAAQMLDFLSKLDSKTKSMINPGKVLDETEVFDILHKVRPEFDIFYNKNISKYEKDLDDEILEVSQQDSLNQVEKDVLRKNLNYMKSYRLQRATNKLAYEELINGCVDLIIKKGITEIDMPFSITFVHVATSFGTTLSIVNHYMSAQVEVMIDRDQPYTTLSIKGHDL